MTTTLNLMMEPRVRQDTDHGRVELGLEWAGTTRTVAGGEPSTVEECDALLLWVERMEAALDNFTSGIRLVQSRMLDAGAIREARELPDDHPSWGAGGRSVYDAG